MLEKEGDKRWHNERTGLRYMDMYILLADCRLPEEILVSLITELGIPNTQPTCSSERQDRQHFRDIYIWLRHVCLYWSSFKGLFLLENDWARQTAFGTDQY